MGDILLKMGQVESVTDDADGGRIKVRIVSDGNKTIQELPYAFPLLPKSFKSSPKVGECVLVITSELNNNESNRYYIGPIISQPQYNMYDPYDYGRGSAISLLQGGEIEPLEKISNYNDTTGAFPDNNDIALVGRKSEDIILKPNEVDIRCGIRTEANNLGNDNLFGEVVFNKQNPSYIQLKYGKNLLQNQEKPTNSLVNIVADKINLISHQDPNAFNLVDNKELIKNEDLKDIVEKLHQVPYGDILVDMLNKIINAIVNHVHPYPGLPPCKEQYILRASEIDLNTLLSDSVRIS